MTIILLALLGTSHALASVPFWRKIRAGLMPATVDFAALSVILYYDIGLFCRFLVPDVKSDYFTPLVESDDRTLTFAVLILIVAPWLFHAGAALARGDDFRESVTVMPSMSTANVILFYIMCAAICVPLILSSLAHARSSDELWVIRARVTAEWGPLIVVLYLPLHLLAFYVAQANSRTWFGLGIAVRAGSRWPRWRPPPRSVSERPSCSRSWSSCSSV